MLMETISSRKELQVDLAHANRLDITAVQLLWAAAREAKQMGASFAVAGDVPENISCAVRDAGLECFLAPMISKAAPPSLMAPPTESTDD